MIEVQRLGDRWPLYVASTVEEIPEADKLNAIIERERDRIGYVPDPNPEVTAWIKWCDRELEETARQRALLREMCVCVTCGQAGAHAHFQGKP